MTTPTCTKCRRLIPPEEINVANDVAYCRSCNISYQLSELTFDNGIDSAVDVNRPPGGCWFVNDGGGTVIGATHRSLVTAAGLLFFALFWNGIVSIFVALATAGTLRVLGWPHPAWFPAPKMNGEEMGVGMVLFLWLFLTPFITVGMFVAGSCLSALFGRTEVRVNGTQGTVFTGVGSLGWRRRFDAAQVKNVTLQQKRNSEGSDSFVLLLEMRAGKQVKLGSLLSGERRNFMLVALRQTLLR